MPAKGKILMGKGPVKKPVIPVKPKKGLKVKPTTPKKVGK